MKPAANETRHNEHANDQNVIAFSRPAETITAEQKEYLDAAQNVRDKLATLYNDLETRGFVTFRGQLMQQRAFADALEVIHSRAAKAELDVTQSPFQEVRKLAAMCGKILTTEEQPKPAA